MEISRTLVLMRHAQTEDTRPGGRDLERQLTEHGEQQAIEAGAFFVKQGIEVDTVLCSSAARTLRTLDLLALPSAVPVEVSDRYYSAGTDTLLEAIVALPEDRRAALIVGHAPAVPGLVYELSDQATSDPAAFAAIESRFPPATIARLTFEGDWSAVGASRLVTVQIGR